jgi:hypothetical protein
MEAFPCPRISRAWTLPENESPNHDPDLSKSKTCPNSGT